MDSVMLRQWIRRDDATRQRWDVYSSDAAVVDPADTAGAQDVFPLRGYQGRHVRGPENGRCIVGIA